MARPPRIGRPRRDPSRIADKLMAIRVTRKEYAEYERTADAAGLSLSNWVRKLCDAAVRSGGSGRAARRKARRS
jgi:hypothetical protein